MSEPSRKDTTDPLRELPDSWRLLLVNGRMKVLATAGPIAAGGPASLRGLDLADVLEKEGLSLAEVGELLVCLEDMPAECELRVRLGEPPTCIVARGFGRAGGVSCIALRPASDPAPERLVSAAWAWASESMENLGLLSSDPVEAPLWILLVDQNPEVLTLGRALARKLGCRARGASSAGSALAEAKKRPYDLALVDVSLQGFGAQVLENLLKERSERQWGHAPVVAWLSEDVCSLVDSEQIAIEKPLSFDELKEVVQIARNQKRNRGNAEAEIGGLPVLQMSLWRSDLPLLRRLSRALVAQGSELSDKLSDQKGYASSAGFFEDLKSLKNGSDILHAYRLGAACRELLESIHLLQTRVWKSLLDNLLFEIEGFRLFADGQGLLGD